MPAIGLIGRTACGFSVDYARTEDFLPTLQCKVTLGKSDPPLGAVAVSLSQLGFSLAPDELVSSEPKVRC